MTIPRVLLIDDDPSEEALAALLSQRGVEARFLPPNDVTARSLRDIDLIVLDEYLSDWPEREAADLPVSLRVADGIALAAVLRAHLDGRGQEGIDPVASRTGIVLRSGRLDDLAAGLPRADRASTVASQHDLEWVMQKGGVEHDQTEVDRILSLGRALAALPMDWTSGDPRAQNQWLALTDVSWQDTALWQIEQCRPPRAVLADQTAGRAWIRWFTSSILTFPTFLIDDVRAATLLGLDVGSLTTLARGTSPVAARLATARYTGELAEFLGRRWWRAGLRSVVDELLDGARLPSAHALGVEIDRLHGGGLTPLPETDPVLTIDRDHFTRAVPIEITDGVRVQPDGWPVYADDPWISAAGDAEEDLRRLVVLDDRDGLGGHLDP